MKHTSKVLIPVGQESEQARPQKEEIERDDVRIKLVDKVVQVGGAAIGGGVVVPEDIDKGVDRSITVVYTRENWSRACGIGDEARDGEPAKLSRAT
jgi:hypothetical protein